jgi:putative membrane protein|tara:strand:+ start:341 stop:1315 length:975 start_codon:yes stop_codon:yes gene_type:complete
MKNLLIALKGMAMGMAETVPGVSGGTIAFITGIYEKLLETIKAFKPSLLKTWKQDGIKAVWNEINGTFIISLLGGMIVGIGIGVVVIEKLIHLYPPVVWAFFFGLIIASIIYIGKQISKWDSKTIGALILGGIIAFGITQIPIGQVNESLWFVFLCGAIAVSALILPGISGSFILLIMGMYSYILHDTLKTGLIENHESGALITMIVFGLGMIVGLVTMARFLTWSLKKHKNTTFAILTGFMIGALNKLWPWRVPMNVMDENDNIVEFSKGMEFDKVITEYSTSPSGYLEKIGEPAFLFGVIAFFFVGLLLVLGMDYFSKKKSH